MKNMFFFMGIIKNLLVRNFEKPPSPTDSWKPITGCAYLQVKRRVITLISQLECTVRVASFQFPGCPCQVEKKISSLFDFPEGEVEDRIVLISVFICVWFEPHWINCVVLSLCSEWQLSSNCKTMKIFMRKKERKRTILFLSFFASPCIYSWAPYK